MKFLAVLMLAAAGYAVAEGDHHHGRTKNSLSVKDQCKEVADLNAINAILANQTKLEKFSHGNANRTAELKAKASSKATQLAPILANSTTIATCNQIFAVRATENDCHELHRLQHHADIAANQTKLDHFSHGNTSRADALKADVAAKAATLSALSSNATLTAFCAGEADKASCRKLKSWQKEISESTDTSAVASKFHNNQTAIDHYQERIANLTTRLQALQSNQTLTDACKTAATSEWAPYFIGSCS